MKKDDVVYYKTTGTIRAKVLKVHNDDDVTVLALTYVNPDGTNKGHYLGFRYKFPQKLAMPKIDA